MTSPFPVKVSGLSKSFLVPRRKGAPDTEADPRRERAGRRDRLHVLRDIAFEVPRGQALAIVGVNGSGKTTLLKIIAGVMQSDAGTAEINGRIGALLEVGAGFHPDLTGEENVHLNGAMLGFSREQMGRHLAEIIAFAGMERFMDMPVRHYSSGMVVRLGFATAIQLHPDILLLDETFAVGDAAFQDRAFRRIQQMKQSGVTMIIVSHSAEQILDLADRAIWLEHGRIAMDADPHSVLSAYRHKAGSLILGGARVVNRLIGRAGAIESRDGESSIRVLRAEIHGERKIESSGRLAIEVEIEIAEGTEPGELCVEAWFRRDDGREVARSRTPLSLSPDSTFSDSSGGSCSSGRYRFELIYNPISLAWGRYEVTLTITRRGGESEGRIEARRTLAEKLEIATPLPFDFRLVAHVEGIWG